MAMELLRLTRQNKGRDLRILTTHGEMFVPDVNLGGRVAFINTRLPRSGYQWFGNAYRVPASVLGPKSRFLVTLVTDSVTGKRIAATPSAVQEVGDLLTKAYEQEGIADWGAETPVLLPTFFHRRLLTLLTAPPKRIPPLVRVLSSYHSPASSHAAVTMEVKGFDDVCRAWVSGSVFHFGIDGKPASSFSISLAPPSSERMALLAGPPRWELLGNTPYGVRAIERLILPTWAAVVTKKDDMLTPIRYLRRYIAACEWENFRRLSAAASEGGISI